MLHLSSPSLISFLSFCYFLSPFHRRRDSFITHRAFCDALAQESARIPTGLSNIGLFANHNNNHNHHNSMGLGLSQVNSSPLSSLQEQGGPSSSDLLRLGGNTGSSQFDHLLSQHNNQNSHSPFRPPPSSAFFLSSCGPTTQDFQEDAVKPFQGLMQLQNTSSATPSLFNLSFFSNTSGSSSSLTNSSNLLSEQFNLMGSDSSSLFNTSVHNDPQPILPQMSATALLQKAAQMGATTSSGNFIGFVSSSKSESFSGNDNESLIRSQMESEANLQNLMNSLANGNAGIFGGSSGASGGGNSNNNNEEEGFGRFTSPGMCEMDESKLHRSLSIGGGSDGLTRDFLGVGSVVRGLGGAGMSHREQHQLGSLDSELRSGSSGGRHFGGGSMQ